MQETCQHFSSVLWVFDLRVGYANLSPLEFAQRADSRDSDCDIKINTIHEGWCSFLWRRKRDIRLWRRFFALPLTSELGLTAVRSRSRENNTQLFSYTLASHRYALYGSNANPILRLCESQRGVRIHSYQCQRNKKNNRAFWARLSFYLAQEEGFEPPWLWA